MFLLIPFQLAQRYFSSLFVLQKHEIKQLRWVNLLHIILLLEKLYSFLEGLEAIASFVLSLLSNFKSMKVFAVFFVGEI